MDTKFSVLQALENWSDILMRQTMAAFMHFLRLHNISFSQMSVLTRMYQHGPVDIITISRDMAVSKAGAGQLIHRMEEQGWLTLQPNPQDKRSRLVVLTETGRQLVEQSSLAGKEWLAKISESLNEQEQQQIAQSLVRLVNAASQHITQVSLNPLTDKEETHE